MNNTVQGYYLKEAWEFAFSGNNSRIIFDVNGNVFKDYISFESLVNDSTGVIGIAGRPTDGQISIWVNPDDSVNGTTGSIQTIIEEQTATHNLTGGTVGTGQWVHFSIKLDSNNRQLTLKINDVLAQTITLSADLNLFSQAKSAVMFRYLNTLGEDIHRYDGMVDDFRIYDKAITDQDETDIYLWGKQDLQFQKKVFIPKKAFSRGCTVGFKFESDDYMQIKTIGIKYRNKNMR